MPGDIIQEVNRKPVRSMTEFDRNWPIAQAPPGSALLNREGHTVFAAVEPR